MGVKQDYPAAIKWLTLAAQQPDAPAQNGPAAAALGAMYEDGKGVPADKKQSFYWYSKAADLGDTRAQWNLGRIYMEGQVVPKDPVLSYMWLKLAALRGDMMATHLLPEYRASKMYSAAQIAEGDRKVKEYQAKHPWRPKPVTPGQA
jgi:TPR repeat protein